MPNESPSHVLFWVHFFVCVALKYSACAFLQNLESACVQNKRHPLENFTKTLNMSFFSLAVWKVGQKFAIYLLQLCKSDRR